MGDKENAAANKKLKKDGSNNSRQINKRKGTKVNKSRLTKWISAKFGRKKR